MIKSPHHPHKYRLNCYCEWHVYTRNKDARIMVILDKKFDMEGNKDGEKKKFTISIIELESRHWIF